MARNNEIVIAVVEGEEYVKRLQKAPVRRIIKLTSANPTHLDIELKEEELDRLRIGFRHERIDYSKRFAKVCIYKHI